MNGVVVNDREKEFVVAIPESRTIHKNKYRSLHSSVAVYALESINGEVLYVGKSTKLRNRIYHHISGRGAVDDPTKITYVSYWNCEDSNHASLLEIYLINKYAPSYNKEFNDIKDSNIPNEQLRSGTLINGVEFQDYWNLQSFKHKKEMNLHVNKFIRDYGELLTPSQKEILKVITMHAVKIPGVSFLKIDTIAGMVRFNGESISRKTVERALNRLNELGIITTHNTIRKRSGGRGSNVYVINKDYSKQRYWNEAT